MLKYYNMKKIIVLVFAICLFAVSNSYAFLSKDGIGTTSAQFLKLGIGAKSAGMGNAVVGVYNGTDAVYWNPSNLNYITRKEFSFSHTVWFEDITYEWLAFVLPTEKYGNFGVAFQYVSYGSMGKVDNNNVSDGTFSPIDMAIYLSYANTYKNFNYGGNLKYIYSKIENSASAYALDLSASYDVTDKLAVGAVLTNLGTQMKFNEESEDLPLLFKIGSSYWILDSWQVALDINFPNDNDFYFNFGTEYNVYSNKKTDIFVRAGYDGRNSDVPGFNWLNFGFGINYLDYVFDYAFVPYGDIGMTHRFSFSIKFGSKVYKTK